MFNYTFENIAKVAHETNRSFCQTLGDFSQLCWENAPDWQKESVIKGVKFHWDSHEKDVTPRPDQSHVSWLEEKERTGWKYGPVKDAEKKEHPCFVPYSELPFEQQMKDSIFGAVVKAFYQSIVKENGNYSLT